jgi:glutamate carboxypeptidase
MRSPSLAPAAACLLLAVAPVPAAAQAAEPAADQAPLEPVERRIADEIAGRAEAGYALLERLVEINSGTYNPAGVQAVADVFAERFAALGFEVEHVEPAPEVERGGHLVARRAAADGAPSGDGAEALHVLLIGHLDTVFEADDPFQAFQRDGDRAHGPGALDMKGGDVAILLALEGLAAADALDALTVTVYLTGDEEEPGRPLAATRGGLVEAAKAADVALGFEEGCCLDGGENGADLAVVARRSSIPWRLEVEGVHSHSSVIFSEEVGAGAVFEAARILHGFYDELAAEEALTFSVGTLLAGTEIEYDPEGDRGSVSGKRNIVPEHAVAYGGLRALTPEQLERAQDRMREIATENLPRTSATLTFEEGYPPMPPTEGNRRLLALYDRVSRDLGLGPVEAFPPAERGAADVSFAAPHADALGGLGPVGEGSHTPREWVSLPTIIRSAQRAALLLHRLGKGDGS